MNFPFRIIRKRKEPEVDPIIRAAQEVIIGDELKSFTHRKEGKVIVPNPPDREVPYDQLKEARKYVIEPISPEEEQINEAKNGIY